MSEVIESHEGIIDDFFGDGILAFFGAPVARPDHALLGVRCAVAMQLALRDVNRANRRQGLPEVEMGIGIATGEVIVGSMGSEKRSKYGAIGLPVNLASRIESCTLGGEILISDATREGTGDAACIDQTREVLPKGFETSLRIHRVVGLAGGEGLGLLEVESSLVELPRPVPVEVVLLDGKQVGRRTIPGALLQLSVSAARIECSEAIAEMTDLRLSFLSEGGEGLEGSCYAKVVSGSDGALTVRFTARPAALIERMRRLLAAVS
jgi:adenylate cyclase